MTIDAVRLIEKYEDGEALTPDEKEIMVAALYFFYRHHRKRISPAAKKNLEEIASRMEQKTREIEAAGLCDFGTRADA